MAHCIQLDTYGQAFFGADEIQEKEAPRGAAPEQGSAAAGLALGRKKMRGRPTGRTLKGAAGQTLRRSGRFRDRNHSPDLSLGTQTNRLRQPAGSGSLALGQHGQFRLFQLLPCRGAGRSFRLGNGVKHGLFADFGEEVGRGRRKPLPHVQLQGLCQIVGMAQTVGCM
jgi:hypothetical protein